MKKTLEPKWNQTFIYSPVHRREFRERMLEITLWDQARVREEESEFLGEVSGTILKLRLFMLSRILLFIWLSVTYYILNTWESKHNLTMNLAAVLRKKLIDVFIVFVYPFSLLNQLYQYNSIIYPWING